MKFLDALKNFLIKTLFLEDIKCIFCDDELNKKSKFCTCENCLKTLPFNNEKVCARCGEEITSMSDLCLNCKDEKKEKYFDQARAPFKYQDEIVGAVHKLKYSNAKYLGKYLSAFMYEEFLKTTWEIDVVIPVPLNSKRLQTRGYNQSELLVNEFKTNGYKIDTTNLIRVVNTPTQTSLSYVERQENLKDAFRVIEPKAFKNKNILIVDDVCTTGATIENLAKCLKENGAKKVYALTLAKVSLENSLDE